jgi:LysR family transcriptional regulator, hydrogen peroxide-inducible genes activator
MSVLETLPVSIRQLQYLVAVADFGSFRRAAEACHVAQPSLSAQVARAERDLGVQLFERNRRAVRVSAAGAALIARARGVLMAAGDLRDAARQAADPLRGTIRLGVIPTVCPYLLPEIAPALRRAFPGLAIAWSEERTSRLVRQMAEGVIDGAILALEAEIGDLDHAVLGRDPFVLAARPGHPILRHRGPMSPDVLDDADVLLLDEGHCLREQVLGHCPRAGADQGGFRGTSLATLVQMVGSSAGVTLLPSIAVPVENRRGQLRVRPFDAPGPGRTLALAWRRDSALADPLARLAAVMREGAGLEPAMPATRAANQRPRPRPRRRAASR